MENIAQIMNPLGHFLSNIRHLQIIAEKKGQSIRINSSVRDDLILAKAFLDKVGHGVSMNLLTFRKPDII